MNATARAFWLRVHRRALSDVPDLNAAILRAIRDLQRDLKPAELERLIAQGGEAAVLARVLSSAAVESAIAPPIRTQITATTTGAANYFQLALPSAARHVGFDILNPNVIVAIRTLASDVTAVLRDDVRETVRQYIAAGVEAGQHPRTVARGIRDVLGLAPNQELAVRNLERELLSGKYKDAARRALIDKRFNLAKLDALSPAERAARIEKIVAAYRKSFIAYHAETVSKAATLSSYKIGQQLTWQQAAARGDIDGSRLMKEWVHFDPQPDPRIEHQEMGRRPPVPFDALYSNGARYAGEDSPWNCRCLDRYFMARSETASTSDAMQFAARRAPTEAIGASAELAAPGWRSATAPEEIARRAALTREAVADVKKAMGYRGDIEVVERADAALRSHLGKDFDVMGLFSPGTKTIALFAENIPSAAEARGVLVHEITHASFNDRILRGPRENFDWMKRNIPALEREDGVSPYSTAFWQRARSGDLMAQRDAINETMAEWSRLRAAGATPTGRPTYEALYNKIFQSAGKKK